MNAVEIRDLPELSVAAVEHQGPYVQIPEAFEKLCAWAMPLNVFGPDTKAMAVFYDNPDVTPADMLRSEACITVPEGMPVDRPVFLKRIPGGKHAVLKVKGPYAELPTAYRWLMNEWLPGSGQHQRALPSYEVYLNDPMSTPPEELLTEIRLPLE